MTYVDLNARAKSLRVEFEAIYESLEKLDGGTAVPTDSSFAATNSVRDGMLKHLSLVESALVKAKAAVKAEDTALQAVFQDRLLTFKRSEELQYWKPIIVQLAAEVNLCTMLMPSISERWFDDPSGEHEERYRDQTDWTNRVRDDGVESIDS